MEYIIIVAIFGKYNLPHQVINGHLYDINIINNIDKSFCAQSQNAWKNCNKYR